MIDIDPEEFEDDFEFGDGLESDDEAKNKEAASAPLKPFKRLALLDYDWEHLNAGDVMLLMHSFLPKQGFISKVTIYPSDFGLKRMKQEEIEGP